MKERAIFRIIVAIMAIIGLVFMAGENVHMSDYFIGCGAIIFATLLLYIVEFSKE